MASHPNIAQYPAHASGYLIRTALYHLLNEGTATAAILGGLSGCDPKSLGQALQRMARDGLTQITQYELRVPCESRYKQYSLTKKGIELAMQIEVRSVHFADPPASGGLT